MTALPFPALLGAPDLAFAIDSAAPMPHSAAPALAIRLGISSADRRTVNSIALQVQLRIAAGGRRYEDAEKNRLRGLFGNNDQWARSVGSLHWTNLTTIVTQFAGATTVELAVPLTYDIDVTSAQYFQALDGGEIPIDLLFTGTMFFTDDDGLLQAAMIPWEKEARFKMPIDTWRAAMDVHFPEAAWIRVPRATFEALHRYRSERAHPNWERTFGALLDRSAT